MNKKYFLLITILLILVNGNLYSQLNSYNISNINNYTADPIDFINDVCFINMNTGFITANLISNGNRTYVYKTTNGGINWIMLWDPWFQPNTGKFVLTFTNANTGYFLKADVPYLYKTTDGGITIPSVPIEELPHITYNPVLCSNSNSDLFIIRKFKNSVCKFPNPLGFHYYPYYFDPSIQLFHIEVSKSSNIIYVCGREHPSYSPFLAKSTDGGTTYSTILDFDGNHDTYYTSSFFHMSIINNNGIDIIKISSANKLIEYNTNTDSIAELTNPWAEDRKISFSDMNNGFYLNTDITPDNPPIELGVSTVYRTTNNGQNWLSEYSSSN